ncbi:hypothetical protein SLEP1_g43154 [Rubroshorea leprosula]|uniref:Uncharacterized protein n=1 Tax=Rubroshorea leprosula TaxID=152421 RepID=A0AAV5LC41_9ROSI|nr:hypothetical protein SLEP1_g43154 [Rubroshorea leprosula]
MEFGGNNRQKKSSFSLLASLFKRRRHHRGDNSRKEEEVVRVHRCEEDNGPFGVADPAINEKASAYIDEFHAKSHAPSELLRDQVDAEKASTLLKLVK